MVRHAYAGTRRSSRKSGVQHAGLIALVFVSVSFMGLLIKLLVSPKSSGPDTANIRREFPELHPAPAGAPSQDLDIYVDDSKSMRGFVSNPNSNYRWVLRQLLQSAEAAQLHVSTFALSSALGSGQRLESLALGQIESPVFYSGKDTALSALLSRIAKRQHTAILITDMVQSERGVDKQGLQASLLELTQTEPEIRLLAYRSDFEGDYYPEARLNGSARTVAVRANQKSDGSGRPFYVLAIAPNAASMGKISDYLLSRIPPKGLFDASAPPFAVTNIALKADPSANKAWATYSSFRALSRSRFQTGFMQKESDPNAEMIELPLTVTLRLANPLGRPAIRLEGERAEWRTALGAAFGAKTQVSPMLEGRLSDKGQPGDKDRPNGPERPAQLEGVITLRNPAYRPANEKGSRPWGVYDLRVSAADGSLDVPAWVSTWSTEDDTTPETANKTFQLDVFIRTLENAVTERLVCGDWILTIN